METEENQRSGIKRTRFGNGKLALKKYKDEEEDDGEARGEINNGNSNQMATPWHHPSSRIYRVSRASGGKDRHSKVYTSKGLRDRRVRLSVSTAIQFYDLQDRLGYDQPSKAIEWLIKAASSAIAELPSLDTTFPDPLNEQPLNIEKSDSGIDPEADPSYNQQQQSSTSETSKGSVLSLSRSDSRVKARERARARERVKDNDDAHVVSQCQNVVDPSLNSQGSFTNLLTGLAITAERGSTSTPNFLQKQMHNLLPVASTTADYFSTQSSFFGQQQQPQPQPQVKAIHQISPSGFSSQAHFGNNSPIGMVPLSLISNGGSDHHPTEMQQFAFLQEHFFPVAAATSGADYNINFSISPSLAGFHRGTLQSNTQPHQHPHQLSHHHQLHQVHAQRLSSALDGSSVPFFFGTPATAASTSSPAENPYLSGFDGHLQLADGYKHLELKGKGKG